MGVKRRRSGFLLIAIAINMANATAQIAMCATSVLCQMTAIVIDMESVIVPTAWFARIVATVTVIANSTVIAIVITIANVVVIWKSRVCKA